MPDARKRPAVILALAASFLAIVLFVLLRPRAEHPSAPEEPAVPEAPRVETPARLVGVRYVRHYSSG